MENSASTPQAPAIPPAVENYPHSPSFPVPPPNSLRVSVSFRNGPVKSLERFYSARAKFESPVHEKAELLKVFRQFDKNGDGSLTVDEILVSLAKMGVIVGREDMCALISSGSSSEVEGSVTFEEFCELYRSMCQGDADEGGGGNLTDANLQSAFDLFDQNRDGYISAVELQSVLTALGFKEACNLEDSQRMISKVDSDGDGKVNFSEFRRMMTNMLEEHQ